MDEGEFNAKKCFVGYRSPILDVLLSLLVTAYHHSSITLYTDIKPYHYPSSTHFHLTQSHTMPSLYHIFLFS